MTDKHKRAFIDAVKARAILTSWFQGDEGVVWRSLDVVGLHEVCDPNMAFDEACDGAAPWLGDESLDRLNRAMDAYNSLYAT